MKQAAETANHHELLQWLDRREPLNLMPGHCSVAEIESLSHIRGRALYRGLGCSWEEFCVTHLGVARRTADQAIGCLEEFGALFFRLASCIDISPQEYRKIAPYLTRGGLLSEGKIIALRAENRERLTRAAANLLRQARAGRRSPGSSVLEAVKRCQAAAKLLRSLPQGLDRIDKLDLAAAVSDIRKAVAGLGVLVARW
jgi:hypothetical protein